MKAILCSIIVISGAMLMLMSSATLTGIRKAKSHRTKPEEKERLISLPVRIVNATSVT